MHDAVIWRCFDELSNTRRWNMDAPCRLRPVDVVSWLQCAGLPIEMAQDIWPVIYAIDGARCTDLRAMARGEEPDADS